MLLLSVMRKIPCGYPRGFSAYGDRRLRERIQKTNDNAEKREKWVGASGKPALFPALVMRGFVDDDCLKNFRSFQRNIYICCH